MRLRRRVRYAPTATAPGGTSATDCPLSAPLDVPSGDGHGEPGIRSRADGIRIGRLGSFARRLTHRCLDSSVFVSPGTFIVTWGQDSHSLTHQGAPSGVPRNWRRNGCSRRCAWRDTRAAMGQLQPATASDRSIVRCVRGGWPVTIRGDHLSIWPARVCRTRRVADQCCAPKPIMPVSNSPTSRPPSRRQPVKRPSARPG